MPAIRSPISALVRSARRVLHGKPPDANIFFMHLPKCGGGSIASAVSACYTGRKPTHTLPVNAVAPAAERLGRQGDEFARDLLVYQFHVQSTGYIGGHYPISDAAWAASRDRWRFVTALRDPVSRWFSHYFYNRHKTHSDLYRITCSPEEFALSDRGSASEGCTYDTSQNGMTRARPSITSNAST